MVLAIAATMLVSAAAAQPRSPLPISGTRTVAADTNAERPLTVLSGTAEIIRYASEPSTVIVGDDSVAGASVASSDILVLTGLGPGETNVIVLDESGAQIDHVALRVIDKGTNVTVRRGQNVETLVCDPACVSPGEARSTPVPVPSPRSEQSPDITDDGAADKPL